jgi:hypothetical protein
LKPAAQHFAQTTVIITDGHINGLYRHTFQIPGKEYGQRWMCEIVIGGTNRTSGRTLRSRKENTLFAEAALKVAAYAIKV